MPGRFSSFRRGEGGQQRLRETVVGTFRCAAQLPSRIERYAKLRSFHACRILERFHLGLHTSAREQLLDLSTPKLVNELP
jgi:hypothetical protein